MRGWILKNLKKIHNIEKTTDEAIVGRNSVELAASFKKYLQVVSE